MDIEPISSEPSKFQTCKFRSTGEVERLIKRCSCKGGNYTIKGYYCEARQIFKVSEEICQECPIYEAK